MEELVNGAQQAGQNGQGYIDYYAQSQGYMTMIMFLVFALAAISLIFLFVQLKHKKYEAQARVEASKYSAVGDIKVAEIYSSAGMSKNKGKVTSHDKKVSEIVEVSKLDEIDRLKSLLRSEDIDNRDELLSLLQEIEENFEEEN
ncbi:hypothetical protein [Thomasclavelia ramosa]|uniref:hypothetical protein n=1 Tax=Thomasclavelia ramosa TaxID=1547 RepID=UPI000E416CF4|nr:hypothetical protein [Thomasclavelia ramosa]RGC87938.1 hypothetical protein DW242_16685 [Thomasclavelia ramosa]